MLRQLRRCAHPSIVPMRRSSCSTQSANVASVSLCSADPQISGRFYIDIAGLNQRPSRGQVDLWDRVGVGAGLTLLQAGNDPSLSDRVAARDATVTIAVSNLRTALRQVLRRGGRMGKPKDAWETTIRRQKARIDTLLILAEIEPGQCALPETEALVSDPDGRFVRLVHAYRRTPLACISLVCENPTAAAAALESTFGLSRISAAESHLVNPPLVVGDSAMVLLAGGLAHSTTAIACVAPSSLDARPSRPADVDARLGAVAGPVLRLRVLSSVTAVHAAVSALGWPVTSVDGTPAAGLSFACCDADGNAFEVVGETA